MDALPVVILARILSAIDDPACLVHIIVTLMRVHL